jgi:isoquinoline 1-oxidoreductase beta subunit
VFDNFVAVVGDHMWAAKQGLAALVIKWDEGASAKVDSAAIWKQIRPPAKRAGSWPRKPGMQPRQ